jgi:hypothetical protein
MGRSELAKLLEEKKKAREKLFQECWPHDRANTLLLMVFTKPDKNSLDLVFKLLEGFLVLPLHVIVVSETQPADHSRHPQGKITWINPENGRNAPKIGKWLTAADAALVFEEKQSTIQALFQKGVVPVAYSKSPLLMNYHPNEETGNSFTYNSFNPWDIFAAIVRACETHHFPYDWQHIIRSILKVR